MNALSKLLDSYRQATLSAGTVHADGGGEPGNDEGREQSACVGYLNSQGVNSEATTE
jgi:hypothetical protein